MKKFLVLILVVALLALWFGATHGFRVNAVTPVEYCKRVYEELPEHVNLVREFTEFYGDGKPQTLAEKFGWYYQNLGNALTFPMKLSAYATKGVFVLVKNLKYLFSVEPLEPFEDPRQEAVPV